MRQETIRWLDAFVGRIVCFLLTVHRRLVDRLFGRGPATARVSSEAPLRSVLFLKLIEQGATVLAAPAIERAVRLVGRENVYFCVFRENRPILDLIDLVAPENVIEIHKEELTELLESDFMSSKFVP